MATNALIPGLIETGDTALCAYSAPSTFTLCQWGVIPLSVPICLRPSVCAPLSAPLCLRPALSTLELTAMVCRTYFKSDCVEFASVVDNTNLDVVDETWLPATVFVSSLIDETRMCNVQLSQI